MPKIKYSELPALSIGMGVIGIIINILISIGDAEFFSWKAIFICLGFIAGGAFLQNQYNKGRWP
jgi:hypothetical protein